MDVVANAEGWLLRVCLKRGLNGAIIALTSYLTSHGIQKALEAHGVTIDWTKFQVEAFTTVCAGLAMLHDYLKVKKGLSWL
jgi:hypothetical protein